MAGRERIELPLALLERARLPLSYQPVEMVAALGLEPRLSLSKSDFLPLKDIAIEIGVTCGVRFHIPGFTDPCLIRLG